MNCTHCEAIRIAHREIMERFSVDHLPRWGERTDIDTALMEVHGNPAGASKCPCDCHAPARIIGTLPRLVAAP